MPKSVIVTAEFSPPPGEAFSASSQQARWYAVHARAHRESAAALQLSQQRFETFLPLHWKTVRHARRFRTVRAPFFPRYLFVRLDPKRQPWRAVNGTFGVSSLVMEGGLPKPVPRGVVEALLSMTDADGVLGFGQSLRPGQRVRVISGPFADRMGELTSLDERDRVKVLLEVMGGQVSIQTSGRALAPL